MTSIIEYLTRGTLPQDPTKASRLHICLARYMMINNKFYKRGFSLPLLKCLTKEQGGNHTGGTRWHSRRSSKDTTGLACEKMT
ncbi:hypothetical protein ACS0TY_015182 [Phlomoides rotata]